MRSAPRQRVLSRHASNQFPDFWAQAWPAQPTARPPAPVQAPTPSMPADHRLRLHDPQLTSPSLRPEPPQPDPKNSIPVVQTRLWLATKEHLELLSQDQILECKILAERQQSTRTRSRIKRKPSNGAGAYQGRARQGVHDPDRPLPPFSIARYHRVQWLAASIVSQSLSIGCRRSPQQPGLPCGAISRRSEPSTSNSQSVSSLTTQASAKIWRLSFIASPMAKVSSIFCPSAASMQRRAQS